MRVRMRTTKASSTKTMVDCLGTLRRELGRETGGEIIQGDRVRLAIEAPREMPVHRTEVHEAIKN